MQEFQQVLNEVLLWAEFCAAFIGVLYIYKLRNSYWKWFSIYLVIIFIQEFFWKGNNNEYLISVVQYYTFFGVPLEYIFLFWLLAYKSLKDKNLFLLSSIIFFVTVYGVTYFTDFNIARSLSITIGTLILMVFIVMEFIQQIKNDDILNFRAHKMFYINMALVIFYIGTFPFHVFGDLFYDEYRKIWDIYYIYFLIANSIMYFLFAASFIWGKQQS